MGMGALPAVDRGGMSVRLNDSDAENEKRLAVVYRWQSVYTRILFTERNAKQHNLP